jgi:prefoldin subunit 5
MQRDEGTKNIASLKQSIQDSEASLRQLKQTIEAVDARLKRSKRDELPEQMFHETATCRSI